MELRLILSRPLTKSVITSVVVAVIAVTRIVSLSARHRTPECNITRQRARCRSHTFTRTPHRHRHVLCHVPSGARRSSSRVRCTPCTVMTARHPRPPVARPVRTCRIAATSRHHRRTRSSIISRDVSTSSRAGLASRHGSPGVPRASSPRRAIPPTPPFAHRHIGCMAGTPHARHTSYRG